MERPRCRLRFRLSGLAIHNILDGPGRTMAVGEAGRVLRPVGPLVLADYRYPRAYADQLTGLGLADMQATICANWWSASMT